MLFSRKHDSVWTFAKTKKNPYKLAFTKKKTRNLKIQNASGDKTIDG